MQQRSIQDGGVEDVHSSSPVRVPKLQLVAGVGGFPIEAWVGSDSLRGWGHWQQQS